MSKKGKGRFRQVETKEVSIEAGLAELETLPGKRARMDAWWAIAAHVLSKAGLPAAVKVYQGKDGDWSHHRPSERPVLMRLITEHVAREGWPPGTPEGLAASVIVEHRMMAEKAGTPAEVEHAFRLGEDCGLLKAALVERKGVKKAPAGRFNIWRALMEHLQSENPDLPFEDIWRALPDENYAIEIEGHELYKDGERLVSFDRTGKERSISKDAFRTGYFRAM